MTITDNNGTQIQYSDLAFAFNPITIEVQSDKDLIRVKIIETSFNIEIDKEARNNKISFDLSAVARSLFDRDQFHKVEETDITLFKQLDFSVQCIYQTQERFVHVGKINVIWGALQFGQKYTQNKTLTYFKGYPFTVPFYSDKEVVLKVNESEYKTLGAGKYNLNLSALLNVPNVKLSVFTKEIISLFDYTFDFTFQDQKFLRNQNIAVNIANVGCPSDGIYLRWINKLGEYNYYLLGSSTIATEVKDLAVKFDNFYTTTDYTNNYHVGSTQLAGKESKQTIKLFASLVNSETYDFLIDLVESPIVDQFMGYDENGNANWLSVSVQNATFTKTTAVLQDFECNLVLNPKQIQTL